MSKLMTNKENREKKLRWATAENITALQVFNEQLKNKYRRSNDSADQVTDSESPRVSEHKEKFVQWPLQKVTKSQPPPSFSPIGLSHEDINTSKWKSENQTEFEKTLNAQYIAPVAGVPNNSKGQQLPVFFAWKRATPATAAVDTKDKEEAFTEPEAIQSPVPSVTSTTASAPPPAPSAPALSERKSEYAENFQPLPIPDKIHIHVPEASSAAALGLESVNGSSVKSWVSEHKGAFAPKEKADSSVPVAGSSRGLTLGENKPSALPPFFAWSLANIYQQCKGNDASSDTAVITDGVKAANDSALMRNAMDWTIKPLVVPDAAAPTHEQLRPADQEQPFSEGANREEETALPQPSTAVVLMKSVPKKEKILHTAAHELADGESCRLCSAAKKRLEDRPPHEPASSARVIVGDNNVVTPQSEYHCSYVMSSTPASSEVETARARPAWLVESSFRVVVPVDAADGVANDSIMTEYKHKFRPNLTSSQDLAPQPRSGHLPTPAQPTSRVITVDGGSEDGISGAISEYRRNFVNTGIATVEDSKRRRSTSSASTTAAALAPFSLDSLTSSEKDWVTEYADTYVPLCQHRRPTAPLPGGAQNSVIAAAVDSDDNESPAALTLNQSGTDAALLEVGGLGGETFIPISSSRSGRETVRLDSTTADTNDAVAGERSSTGIAAEAAQEYRRAYAEALKNGTARKVVKPAPAVDRRRRSFGGEKNRSTIFEAEKENFEATAAEIPSIESAETDDAPRVLRSSKRFATESKDNYLWPMSSETTKRCILKPSNVNRIFSTVVSDEREEEALRKMQRLTLKTEAQREFKDFLAPGNNNNAASFTGEDENVHESAPLVDSVPALGYVAHANSYKPEMRREMIPSQSTPIKRPSSAPALGRRATAAASVLQPALKNRRGGKDNGSNINLAATNPILGTKRYPLLSDRQVGRWTSEARSSFTWKAAGKKI